MLDDPSHPNDNADPTITIPVADQTIDIPVANPTIDQCAPKARHANVIFAQAAFHQLSLAAHTPSTADHFYDEGFKDAIDHQLNEWKDDHFSPAQLLNEPTALEHYWFTVSELLKHQRSSLRALLLTNILETQRLTIK
ncbi:hypothetical protein PtB15_8B270 [Puccinia triticina]|nr:hypothetical protein PtB15_8B270 [Puccinia triticina]